MPLSDARRRFLSHLHGQQRVALRLAFAVGVAVLMVTFGGSVVAQDDEANAPPESASAAEVDTPTSSEATPAIDAAAAEPPAPSMEDRSWDRRTYDVRIEVVATPGLLRDGELDAIAERLRAAIGPAAAVSIRRRATFDAEADASPLAKRLLVELSPGLVGVQEHDAWLDDRGPRSETPIPHRSLLVPIAADRAFRAFRPRMLIEQSDDGLTAQPWGRAYDRDLVAVGDLARPILRFTDRDGAFRDTRPVLWTFARVVGQTELEIELDLISGFRQPIPKRIRRGEAIALVETALFDETELLLQTDGQPTAGLAVRAEPIKPPKNSEAESDAGAEDSAPLFRSRSDRFGTVTLPRANHPRVVWLSVTSESTLARVPIAIGHRDRVVVPLIDDAITIGLTERLTAIRADLTDTFASRVVLMARARKASKEKAWALVDEAFEAIDSLPTAEDYFDRLNAARVEATIAAGNDRRTIAEARLAAEWLARTIRESLDKKPIDDLRTELAEIRRLGG